eukprot:COSAG02_NODE_1128_length_14425_cov_18.666271_7_plen_197_part_00
MSAAQMKLAHQVSGPVESSKHMIFDPAAEVGATHQAVSAAHAADAAAEQLLSSLARFELPREVMLQEIFEHFDEDSTGALDHAQTQLFLQALTPGITVSEEDWLELCTSLNVEPRVGLPRGADHFDTFFEGMDAANIRSVHSSVTPNRGLGGASDKDTGGDDGAAKEKRRESEEERTARLLASRASRNGSTRSPGM